MEANNDTQSPPVDLISGCRVSFSFKGRSQTGWIKLCFRSCRKQPDGSFKEFDSLLIVLDDYSGATYSVSPYSVQQILYDPREDNNSQNDNNLTQEDENDEILETNKNGASQ